MRNDERFGLQYKLGDRVKDEITGFEGIVVCVVKHYKSSLRIGLAPEEPTDDNEKPEEEWFDADRLELVESNIVEPKNNKSVFKVAEAMDVKQGDKVEDSVTGFEGTLTSFNDWLYGCHFMGIKPQELDSEGNPVSRRSFPVDRIEVIERDDELRDNEDVEEQAYSGGPNLEQNHEQEF